MHKASLKGKLHSSDNSIHGDDNIHSFEHEWEKIKENLKRGSKKNLEKKLMIIYKRTLLCKFMHISKF
jgi:hypothetical protein